jgi:hypothetical protein
MTKAEYAEYRMSPHWARMRGLKLTACRGICEVCHDAAAEDVHHIFYHRLWNEELDDLSACCRRCHTFAPSHAGWADAEPIPVTRDITRDDYVIHGA